MRTPIQSRGKQQTKSFPAPIGGMNVRDPIGLLPDTDAVNLINWIPQHYGLKVRKGYREWATGLSLPVQTVMQYFPQSATIPTSINFAGTPTTLPGKVFAATDANIYEITSTGSVGAGVRPFSGAQNAGVVHSNMFTNSGGSFLLCNSEIDGYLYYDGTSWITPIQGTMAGQVNGVNPANLIFNLPWHHRTWFIEKSSSRCWYTDTDALTGTFHLFDFGPLFKNGGAVAYLANWTIDAGTGIDDMLVVVSENGDVLIYKGSDPASSTTFALVGQWNIGEVPKGRRAFIQYGGDLLFLSKQGLIPLSYVTRGGANMLQASDGEYTSKIQGLIGDDLAVATNLFGWEVLLHPAENLLIVTVPDNNASVSKQYVMNTINNGWCLFNGMPMTTTCMVSGFMLFGTPDGRVCMSFTQWFDNLKLNDNVGSAVQGFVQGPFSYFDAPGAMKHFLMVRPTFIAEGPPAVTVTINTDFTNSAPGSIPTYIAEASALFDAAKWDINKWGGSKNTYQTWQGANGQGYLGSIALLSVTAGDTQLSSIDFMMEIGGPM